MSHAHRPSLLVSFTRAQVSAFLGSALDFLTMIGLVELLKVWYVGATACGAFVGALANFILGRHWSFKAHHAPVAAQVVRYCLVSGTSLLLNSIGVFAFKEYLRVGYLGSRVVVSFLVAVLFNFPLHRGFVFR